MTTIAARLSTLEIAADSQVSGDDVKYYIEKLRRGKGCIFGGAGDLDKLLKFYDSVEKSGDFDDPIEVDVLELRHDGIYVYESTIHPVKVRGDFFAVGTGSAYALAAMHLGKSPKEAIEIASIFDPVTGGPVDVMILEPLSVTSGKRKKLLR
jgi:ATP-dependent protease HslVU (ClpYQ) peptidase subunit